MVEYSAASLRVFAKGTVCVLKADLSQALNLGAKQLSEGLVNAREYITCQSLAGKATVESSRLPMITSSQFALYCHGLR